MKRVMQTRLHRNGEPPGNCFAACLASILETELEEVPWPDEGDREDWCGYWTRVAHYLDSIGFLLVHVPFLSDDEDRLVPPKTRLWTTCDELEEPGPLYIANGPGPRGSDHSVVMRDGELQHDPHPDGGGILRLRSIELLIPR